METYRCVFLPIRLFLCCALSSSTLWTWTASFNTCTRPSHRRGNANGKPKRSRRHRRPLKNQTSSPRLWVCPTLIKAFYPEGKWLRFKWMCHYPCRADCTFCNIHDGDLEKRERHTAAIQAKTTWLIVVTKMIIIVFLVAVKQVTHLSQPERLLNVRRGLPNQNWELVPAEGTLHTESSWDMLNMFLLQVHLSAARTGRRRKQLEPRRPTDRRCSRYDVSLILLKRTDIVWLLIWHHLWLFNSSVTSLHWLKNSIFGYFKTILNRHTVSVVTAKLRV